MATRVAEEMKEKIGGVVGYAVRFEDVTSHRTRLKYVTDGMLLRELISNPTLKGYTHIIIDEAHERTLRTDILFGMIKEIQKSRKLKLVIMSATLAAKKFSEYFGNAPIIQVSGRQFPVRLFYTLEPMNDYLEAVMITIFQIHLESKSGDVLVFLTGQEEIESVASLLMENVKRCPEGTLGFTVCPIFSALPTHQQAKVFHPTPEGTRKIILATNIAETSITIPNVKYVIDPGVVKMRLFDSKTGIESLAILPVSKSSAKQRLGRAGRVANGFCYRLFTEESYNALEEETLPEMQRSNLSNIILMMKASGIEDVLKFDYIDRPSNNLLKRSMEELLSLGALAQDGTISKIGLRMADFPLQPTLSKVLLKASEFGCARAVSKIIALLSVDNIFFAPSNSREEASKAKQLFKHPQGDHLTYLNAYESFLLNSNQVWCKQHFINYRAMKQVTKISTQILQLLERKKMAIGDELDPELILKSFLDGFAQNCAIRQPNNTYKVGNQVVSIHPASVLFGSKADCVLYNEITHTTKCYLRGVSKIEPVWIMDRKKEILKK